MGTGALPEPSNGFCGRVSLPLAGRDQGQAEQEIDVSGIPTLDGT